MATMVLRGMNNNKDDAKSRFVLAFMMSLIILTINIIPKAMLVGLDTSWDARILHSCRPETTTQQPQQQPEPNQTKSNNKSHHHHDKSAVASSTATTVPSTTSTNADRYDDYSEYTMLLEQAIRKESIKNKVFWEWKYYSRITQEKKHSDPNARTGSTNQMKGLIVQYSDHYDYSKLLKESQKANEAYAWQYGYDYLTVRGVMLQEGTILPPGAGAFNKPYILQHILDQQTTDSSSAYDFVFLLDSDAVITNFTLDVASLVDITRVFVAQIGLHEIHDDGTNLINNGVTLWNYRHELLSYTLLEWTKEITKLLQNHSAEVSIGDQLPLHQVLLDYQLQHPTERLSRGWQNMFDQGIFVHHVLRSWVTTDIPTFFQTSIAPRHEMLKKLVEGACAQYGCDLPNAVETATFVIPALSRPSGVCGCF